MRGLIFRELFNFIEAGYGADTLEDIISASGVPNDGAYTTVGNYDEAQLLALVSATCDQTGLRQDDAIRAFGRYLFGRLMASHVDIARSLKDTFGTLEVVQRHIHAEVRKLYPESALPDIAITSCDGARRMTLTYGSGNPLAFLAFGLIEGAIDHFGEDIGVRMVEVDGNRTSARFEIERNDPAAG